MPHKQKAKIIQFPRTTQKDTPAQNDVFAELKDALASSKPIQPAVELPTVVPEPHDEVAGTAAPHIVINGGQGIQIGDIHNHNYGATEPVKPIVIVQTGHGTIDAQQKRRLLDLRDEIVNDSVVRNTPKMPGSVMTGLNRYMKVNKYDEILSVDFEKALNWMVRQRAILNSARSAPKKLPAWRNGRIKAIHSRCKERGFEDWRIEHMKKKFGKSSMLDLPDADLEALYRTVMSKK